MGQRNIVIRISGEGKGTLVLLLVTAILLLMWVTISLISLRDTFKETKTEIRLLQMHVQDQNAILIREGVKKVGDSTTGATHPDKMRRDDERNEM
jgi:cell division protein FtsL